MRYIFESRYSGKILSAVVNIQRSLYGAHIWNAFHNGNKYTFHKCIILNEKVQMYD